MHYIMAMLYIFSETFSNNTHWKGLLICFPGYLDYFFFSLNALTNKSTNPF